MPELWPVVLQELSQAVGAGGAMMLASPKSGLGVMCSSDIEDLTHAFGQGDWVRLNPRPGRGLALMKTRGADIITDEMCFTPHEMDHHSFHADLLARFGFRSFAGLVVSENNASPLLLSLERRTSQGPYTNSEIDALRRLAPHLRGAGSLALRIADARANGLFDGFEQMHCGAFLLDGWGKVLRMNPTVKVHIGNGLSIAGGRLTASDWTANARVQHVVSAALWPKQGAGPLSPLTAPVPRPLGRPLIVSAAPPRWQQPGSFSVCSSNRYCRRS